MGNDPGAAGLALAFSGYGHANFKAIMAERCTHLRMLQELVGQSCNIFFNGGVFFSGLAVISCPFAGRTVAAGAGDFTGSGAGGSIEKEKGMRPSISSVSTRGSSCVCSRLFTSSPSGTATVVSLMVGSSFISRSK